MGLRKVGASQRSPNWKLVSRRGSFLISDANACARGNGRDVGVMTLTVHKFSFFSSCSRFVCHVSPQFFHMFVFFANKKKPSVTGDKNNKNAAAYGAMALGCGLCGRGSGSGDLRFCLRCPKKSQRVMKTKGQRTNICILYAYYIYSQFYEVGPPNIYYI